MAEHDPGRTATPATTTTQPARWRPRGLGLVAALVMTAGLLSACDSSPVVLSGDVTYAAPAAAARTTDAVVDTTDSLAAGVLVQLFADDTETAVATTRTNPVGHYGFHASQVDDGTYRLLIGDTWVGGETWQDATSIAVSSSEGTTVDQQLTRAGSISGTIVDAAGDGVADAVVVATASDGTIVSTTVTDATGAFTLGVPSDGTYTVSFNAGDDPVDVGGHEADEFVIDADAPDVDTGSIDVDTGTAPAPAWDTTVTVTGASAQDGLTVAVNGSDYTDLPNASTGSPAVGLYVGLRNPADTLADIAADNSLILGTRFLYGAGTTNPNWNTELAVDAANLDPNVDYDVFIWVAHGNPTADTVLVSTPIELTRAQKDALFG